MSSRDFNGATSVIDAGAASVIANLTNGLTVACWINPRTEGEGDNQTRGRIAHKSVSATGVSDGWALYVIVNTGFAFQVGFATKLLRESADASLTWNRWQHVAATWAGPTTAATSVLLYRDFVQPSYKTSQNGGGAYPNDVLDTLRFGNASTTARTFDGLMAHMHLYNRVLAVGELQSVAYRPGSVRTGLLGYWPFWGSATEYDYSGQKNDGGVSLATISASTPPVSGIGTHTSIPLANVS